MTSAAETARSPPIPSVDTQLIAARWSARGLAALIPIGLVPAFLIPNAMPFALLFGALVAPLLVRSTAQPLRFDLVTPFGLSFVTVGLLYVAASMLELLPAGPYRPVRHDFVLRHAYYVILWIPLIAGATAFFRNLVPDLLRILPRAAQPGLAVLALGDVASAALIGDPERIQWEGYTYFFDPAMLTLLYAAIFFLSVATSRRVGVPLAIATAHCALSNIAGYGMMFNTITGMFVFASMWSFALGWRCFSVRGAFYAVVAVAVALFAALLAGALLPEILGFDINSHWRFLVWRENLLAALESGLLGVGFGTPYYELSLGNIGEAFRLSKFSEFTRYAIGSPIDILYIRGQHSSFVNAFYRMGVMGGGLLVAFNLAVLALVVGALRRSAPSFRPFVAAAGALFVVEASQMAMHVGLESPRYFGAYALAVGLARAAAYRAGRAGHV